MPFRAVLAYRLEKQTCDRRVSGSSPWSERHGSPSLITTSEVPLTKALNPKPPVELLCGQQIGLWLYWAATFVTVIRRFLKGDIALIELTLNVKIKY